MKRVGLVFLILFFAGCGYRPLAHYARNSLGEKVYVQVEIDVKLPKASSKVKDLLNQALVSRLHLELVSKEEAKSVIRVRMVSVSFDVNAEDDQGFGTHYRANVDMNFSYRSINGREISLTLNGSSDYAATQEMSTIAIEKARLGAIVSASEQAIDKFVSQLFYQGVVSESQAS